MPPVKVKGKTISPLTPSSNNTVSFINSKPELFYNNFQLINLSLRCIFRFNEPVNPYVMCAFVTNFMFYIYSCRRVKSPTFVVLISREFKKFESQEIQYY